MTRSATCLLCGVEDRDVAVGLVEIPEAERRVVAVSLPVTHRDGAVEISHDVREVYAAMPRCRDAKACAERVRAFDVVPVEPKAPDVPPPAHDQDDEEGPTWKRS